MKNRNIRSKDLNLIPIFHALMAERNVSRAAETLGLTQPAISHALKRLRFDFGDDLFVRSAKGMVPTPFALALREKMTPLVATLEEVYQTVGKFDLKTTEARISVATTDYVAQNPDRYALSPAIVFQPHPTLRLKALATSALASPSP